MDIEDRHKLCSHFDRLKKKEVHKLLEEWNKGGVCYKRHTESATPKDPSLRISLSSYELGCARDTKNQCLIKDFGKDKDQCISFNPLDGSIW